MSGFTRKSFPNDRKQLQVLEAHCENKIFLTLLKVMAVKDLK